MLPPGKFAVISWEEIVALAEFEKALLQLRSTNRKVFDHLWDVLHSSGLSTLLSECTYAVRQDKNED